VPYTSEIIGIFITLAALWHVMGFAFGLVYVRFSLLSLLGKIPYQREWRGVLRYADLHIWLSGFVLIGLGIWDKGFTAYIYNPKLWCKVTVVVIWMLSTQMMRFIGIRYLKQGNKQPMLHLSAINISCWIYGAFLGCAKPLGYGVMPYSYFQIGFLFVAVLCLFGLQKICCTE
jgi:hypothetical protein